MSLPERAAQDIRDAVRSGAYPDGRLPAEPVLAQQLSVSKATVRHAVSILEQEGLLSRRQGAGTFIVGRALELRNNLSVNFGVTDLIESAGFVAGTSAMSVDIEVADPHVQRALGLSGSDRVLVLRRTRTADERIVARTTDIVPLALLEARGLAEPAAIAYVRGRRSVYEAMAGLGVQVRDGVAEIYPWQADEDLALGTADEGGRLASCGSTRPTSTSMARPSSRRPSSSLPMRSSSRSIARERVRADRADRARAHAETTRRWSPAHERVHLHADA